MTGSTTNPRIIVALDVPDRDAALVLAARLDPRLCRLKIGKQLFTAAGPALVEELQGRGFELFLDLKYHDIPNTVAGACRVCAGLGLWMINVHALGGRRMLEAAREAVDAGTHRPLLIAVTVLTSMERPDLAEVGLEHEPVELVLKLARLATDCGLDGLVCSPREAGPLRRALGSAPLLVTPGIRPAAADDDQRRTATPRQAIIDGASLLVIGRPITRAADPLAALQTIDASLDA